MNPNNINPAVIAISGLLCCHSAFAISAGIAVKTALQNRTEETPGLVLFPHKFLIERANAWIKP